MQILIAIYIASYINVSYRIPPKLPLGERLSIQNPFPGEGGNLPRPSLSTFTTILAGGVSIGSILMIIDPLVRDHVLRKLEFITSPNHAAPENKGPFHIRTLQQELNQSTQLDRAVHFMIPYLLTNYAVSAAKDVAKNFEFSQKTACLAAIAVVGAGSIIDEYLDGFQRDDGFSPFDFGANILGVLCGLLKQQNKLQYIDISWDFCSEAKPDTWKWAWWNYMPAYAFRVRIDIMQILTGEDRGVFDEYTKYFAYLPFMH